MSLLSSQIRKEPESGVSSPRKAIVVFSGGSAANNLVDIFSDLAEHRSCPLNYIIPISDNGGSSSELIRVFGGPGFGDIRSRLVRLIPPSHASIRTLLNHRLPPTRGHALFDWNTIVDGTSSLWPPIHSGARELLRSMLNHLNLEIIKRARPPHGTFNFASASVGNLFLTGARLFTGSFESAIYLLTLIGGIGDGVNVIPAINSNFSHHISAGLTSGIIITGQNAISHPSEPTALLPETGDAAEPYFLNPLASPPPLISVNSEEHRPEDATLPGSLPTLRTPNIHFSKEVEAPLPARIERIWYINPYGQEICAAANPKAAAAVRAAEVVIFSIGSLYTSIVPCLILRGIGEALAAASVPGVGARCKILILNGSLDRETGRTEGEDARGGMDASEFVAAIARAGEESQGRMGEARGDVWKKYVTHLIYLEGDGAPKVNRKHLSELGVEPVRCWGRKGQDGSMQFDPVGLAGALDAVVGKREWKGEKSRRNTQA